MKSEKTAKNSRVILARIMMPEDANPMGIVHGGVIMKEIDNAAGVAAVRHAGKICVTASIDRLDFHNPAFIGNIITVKASINMTGRTSMEIGVRVENEDILAGVKTHIASAYLTFVALGEDRRPAEIPSLKLISKKDIRRNKEALARRALRLTEKKNESEK